MLAVRFVSLITAVSVASAWRISNFGTGDCSGSGSIISGTGESDCLGIDPGVFGIIFDPQGENLALDWYAFDCPSGPIGRRSPGGECDAVCIPDCFSSVEVVNAFS